MYESLTDLYMKELKFDKVNDTQSFPDLKTEDFNNFITLEMPQYTCDDWKSKGTFEAEVKNLINELPDELDGTTIIT